MDGKGENSLSCLLENAQADPTVNRWFAISQQKHYLPMQSENLPLSLSCVDEATRKGLQERSRPHFIWNEPLEVRYWKAVLSEIRGVCSGTEQSRQMSYCEDDSGPSLEPLKILFMLFWAWGTDQAFSKRIHQDTGLSSKDIWLLLQS